MILALALDPAWTPEGGRPSLVQAVAMARLAEQADLDLILVGSPGGGVGPDPMTVASALIPHTSRIGLGALTTSSGWAPFNVARALSALDWLSGGRAAWLAAPGADPPGRFAEHLEVVLELFDSWEDEALVFDKAAGVFTDRDRVRRIVHAGPGFTVDGPLNSPRPPQGWPVIVQFADAAAGDADLLVAPSGAAAGPASALTELPFALASVAAAGVLAGEMAAAFDRGACQGFVLRPDRPVADLQMFAQEVAPRLEHQGLRAPWTGPDLRTRLGLERPANRYARGGDGTR